MKPRCGSCSFFKSHKPVTPGAGGNSECLRTPGYYRSPVMDSCKFYEKKGKKVASKKKEKQPTVRCPHCNVVILNSGGTWCAKTEWVNIKCSKCDKPVLLSATSAEKREDTPLLCSKCFRVLQGIQYKIKGRKGLLCQDCHTEEGGEKKISEVPKVTECLECPGCHFKFSTEESDKIRRFPDLPQRCTSCGYSFILVDGKLTRITPLGEVTEKPIYERFLVIEGRGAWPCTNVYTYDFSNSASALKFVDRYRLNTCKMFRVSSTAPITLEELSLGYDIKVVSTHEMKEPK